MAFIEKAEEGRRVWRPFFMRLIAALLVVMTGATPAQAAMRGYIVTSFDSIRVEAPVRVILTTGSGVSGSGEGDREALDRVQLSVSGGLLTVRMADGPSGGFGGDDTVDAPTIMLSTGQLRRAMVLGGAVLAIRELAGLEADLSMSGNGEMIVEEADIDRLNLYVGGGGKLTISGTAREVRATVNGPGELAATGLEARGATIANDGPGSITMTVSGQARVTSTGSGDTIVQGQPSCTVNRRGVGKVICGAGVAGE